jgi:hypothetical protein
MIHHSSLYTLACLLAIDVGVIDAAFTLPIRGVKRKTLQSATLAAANGAERTVKSGIRNADLSVCVNFHSLPMYALYSLNLSYFHASIS